MGQEIATVLEALKEFEWVAREQLRTDWQEKLSYLNLAPIDAIFPKTPEELARAVTLADREHWTIIPCGNATKLPWGGLAKTGQLLISTKKMARLVEHAVGDLTVTVEAGMKLADLQAALEPSRQFLPLDPAYPENATLGGIVATADSGSWRHRYGGVRDLLLGLSFARADGKIAKAGGRVVKNVAGYDLMKLISGSYGSLGIISQLTFRTYPLPEASATILVTGDFDKIASLSQTLLNSSLSPARVDLLSRSILPSLAMQGELGLAVEFASIPESVKEQQEKIAQWGEQLGLTISRDRQIWPPVQQLTRMRHNSEAIIAKIGILPASSVPFLQALDGLSQSQDFGLIHGGSGLGYLHLQSEEAIANLPKLRERCQEDKGFLTILEAPTAIKKSLDSWGYSGNALKSMQQIKQKFDRDRLLGGGRFVGGI